MKSESKFYEIMRNFVIKSLNLLKKEESYLPFRLEEEISVENLSETSMSLSSKFTQKPDFVTFVYRQWNKIKKLREYEECKVYMEKYEVISKHLNKLVGTYEQKGRVEIDRILQTLILDIIYQQNNFKFDESFFLRKLKEVEEFFTNSKLKFCASAPLEGFTSTVDEIQLDKNLRIVKISKENFAKLFGLVRFGFPIPQNKIFHFRFMLERIYETDKIIGEENKKPKFFPSQETKKIFNEVISALRLLKAGVVGYNFIQTIALDWDPIGGILTNFGIFTYPYFGHYKLENHEIENFKSLFQKIKNAPNFLDVSITRFNFASDRERPEDKLIDYITAFESLFVKEKQELSYRLSVRVALLIGKDKQDRKQIFELIKKAYDLRSKIVHGLKYEKNVKINDKNISIQEFVSKIEEILRTSIKSALQFKDHPSFLEKIDEKIFEVKT